MLYLKAANFDDIEKEYEALQKIPKVENGFQNKYNGVSFEEFKNIHLPELINYSKGINIAEDHVPGTYFFLWENDTIIGLFKIRHTLNERLKTGPGHIGMCIIEGYRHQGYASKGLKLAIEEFKKLNQDNIDEIYLACYKSNIASYKAQINNGAYLHHEDEEEYYTRIKI